MRERAKPFLLLIQRQIIGLNFVEHGVECVGEIAEFVIVGFVRANRVIFCQGYFSGGSREVGERLGNPASQIAVQHDRDGGGDDANPNQYDAEYTQSLIGSPQIAFEINRPRAGLSLHHRLPQREIAHPPAGWRDFPAIEEIPMLAD